MSSCCSSSSGSSGNTNPIIGYSRPTTTVAIVISSTILLLLTTWFVSSKIKKNITSNTENNNQNTNNQPQTNKDETPPTTTTIEPPPEQSDEPITDDFITINSPTTFLYKTKSAVPKEQIHNNFFSLEVFQPNINNNTLITRHPIHPSIRGFIVDGLLTPTECQFLIDQTESTGMFTSWTTDQSKLGFRSCDTIECIRPDFASQILYQRLQHVLLPDEQTIVISSPEQDPIRWQRDLEGKWLASGTNDCLLFSRYSHENHFAAHTDGFNIVSFDHRSFFSIVLYLNDVQDDVGGETVFFSDGAKSTIALDKNNRYVANSSYTLASIAPKAGRAVIFFHNILHQSQPITSKTAKKYIIRSDIMYKRTPPVLTKERDLLAFKEYQKAEELAETDPDAAAILYRKVFKMSPKLADVYGG
jgi:hypothetical protein